VTVNIDLKSQLNSDGSLAYLRYKYKGSEVKIGLGYDANGNLNQIQVPAFLNLKPEQIYNLVMQQYLERINHIGDIAVVDLISAITNIVNIANIAKIGSVIPVTSSSNIVQNGDLVTLTLSGWTTTTNTTYDAVFQGAKLVQNAVFSQDLPAYVGNRLHFSFITKSSLVVAGNLVVTLLYTDGSTEVQTFNVPAIETQYFINSNYQKRLATLTFGQPKVDTVYLKRIVGIQTDDDLQGNIEVLPKAKGKTTIIKSAERAGGAGSSTIYTVTAGKTFYLVAANLCSPAAGSGKDFLQADTGGDGVFRNLLNDYMLVSALITALVTPSSLSLAVPMPFPAGTVFRVTTDSANTIAEGSIVGWEE
jgi:hypothetical protein